MLECTFVLFIVVCNVVFASFIYSSYENFISSITNFDRYMIHRTTYNGKQLVEIENLENEEATLKKGLERLKDGL